MQGGCNEAAPQWGLQQIGASDGQQISCPNLPNPHDEIAAQDAGKTICVSALECGVPLGKNIGDGRRAGGILRASADRNDRKRLDEFMCPDVR